MKKNLTLSFMLMLSCSNLLAPHQRDEQDRPLLTPKECCILAAWMLAGTSVRIYNNVCCADQGTAQEKAPIAKKMN